MALSLHCFWNNDRSHTRWLGPVTDWGKCECSASTRTRPSWEEKAGGAADWKDEPRAITDKPVSPSGKRLRILIVEDNRDAAHSLRILLELLGHQVAVAYTGPEGLQRALSWRPEVVLSDIGLPGGLDGWALAKELRKNASTAGVRLIAITGYGSEEDRRHSREAQFDYHLTKPVDPAVLQEIIAGHDEQ